MIPALIAGGALAISAGSAIYGAISGSHGRAAADAILEEAQRKYGNIDAPTLERVVAEQLGPTALEKIRTDPAYKQAQLNALAKLGEMEQGGGFTNEDRATLNRSMNTAARTAAGANARASEEMAARGASGSGAEWAMMQAGAQSAAGQAYQTGLDVAGQAQKRYYDSILARGQMAGQLRSQDWNEQAQVAQANDEIARFNAASRERANYYNAGLAQQNFQNQMALANQQYGWAQDRANLKAGKAAQSAGMIAGAGNAIGNAGMMVAGYLGQPQAPASPAAQVNQHAAPGTTQAQDYYAYDQYDPNKRYTY